MFFAGRLQRPPWETRKRVEALVKQLDRTHIRQLRSDDSGSRRCSRALRTSIDLWDRGLRAREEGRPGPFAQPRPAAEKPKPSKREDRILHVTTFEDPLKEMDKLHELYDNLAQARREAGQEAIPFHKFADLIKTQVEYAEREGQPGSRVPRGGEGRKGGVYCARAQGKIEQVVGKVRGGECGVSRR